MPPPHVHTCITSKYSINDIHVHLIGDLHLNTTEFYIYLFCIPIANVNNFLLSFPCLEFHTNALGVTATISNMGSTI